MTTMAETTPLPALVAARLKPEEAARLIGCAAHDIPILIRAGLLKPLGRVQPNAVKYFSKRKVNELCEDDTWLAKVTDVIARHWRLKNERRRHVGGEANEALSNPPGGHR